MSLPGRGPAGLMSRVYASVEKFMPWKYTGVYSSPEFKSHVPVVGEWRTHAPTNPAFGAFQLFSSPRRHPISFLVCMISEDCSLVLNVCRTLIVEHQLLVYFSRN
jgi:hypothetical protein